MNDSVSNPLRCRACAKALAWELDYCPFCGASQKTSDDTLATAIDGVGPLPAPPQPLPEEKPPIVDDPATPTDEDDGGAKTPAGSNPPIGTKGQEDGQGSNDKEAFPWLGVAALVGIGLLARNYFLKIEPSPGYPSPPMAGFKPIEPEMVFIKGGSFQMGSPESADENQEQYPDEHQHEVQVNDFHLGKYEVTFEEYDRFAQATHRPLPDDGGHGRGRHPVNRVSWEDANAYTHWLAEQTGKHYHLPTEAEWEYAARAGTASARFWGDGFDLGQACQYANYMECPKAPAHSTSVGAFQPNPWGLHDMLGNVLELTASAYDEEYQGGERRPARPEDGDIRVMRGGSWYRDASSLRSAWRGKTNIDTAHNLIGFRLARD